jgi:hypothetical protein
MTSFTLYHQVEDGTLGTTLEVSTMERYPPSQQMGLLKAKLLLT